MAGAGTEGSHSEPQTQNRESELGVAWIFKDFQPTPLEGDTLPSKTPQTVPPNWVQSVQMSKTVEDMPFKPPQRHSLRPTVSDSNSD